MKKIILLILLVSLVSCQSKADDPQTESNLSNNNRTIENTIESNQDIENTENETIEEEEHEEAVDMLVTIAVDSLNIRTSDSIDSEIIGQYVYGDQVEVLNEVLGSDSEMWYQTSYEGQDAYIAKRFTIYGKRECPLYDDNVLLGFYDYKDLNIYQNNQILLMKRDQLYETLEVVESDKHMTVYIPFKDNRVNLAMDMTFEYGNVQVKLDSNETNVVKYTYLEDVLLQDEILMDLSHRYTLMTDQEIISLGKTYVYDEKDREIIFVNESSSSYLSVYHLDGQTYDVDFKEPIISFVIEGEAGQVSTASNHYIIERQDEQWVSTIDPSHEQAYELLNERFIPVDLLGVDTSHSTETNYMTYEDGVLYSMNSFEYEDKIYYLRQEMDPETIIDIEGALTLFSGGQENIYGNFAELSYEVLDQGILITFDREEIGDYIYYDNRHYVAIEADGHVIDFNNFISFSKDKSYMINALITQVGASDIIVYDRNLQVLHHFDDISHMYASYLLEHAWQDNEIVFKCYKAGANPWRDINNTSVLYEERFNPITKEEEEQVHLIKDQVTLDVYNTVNGHVIGTYDLEIGQLAFSNYISYEDGNIILWFKHDLGYVKRIMHEDSFTYNLPENLYIVTEDTTHIFQDYYTAYEISNFELENYIHIRVMPDTGDDGYVLFNMVNGITVPVGYNTYLSPSQELIATYFDSNMEHYFEFSVTDLKTGENLFIQTSSFSGEDHPFITYSQIKWVDEDTISIMYADQYNGPRQERFIKRSDNGVTFELE